MDGTVLELHRKGERPGQRGIPKPGVPENRTSTSAASAGTSTATAMNGSRTIRRPPSSCCRWRRSPPFGRKGGRWPPVIFGENITTSGIPYETFRPGSRVRAVQPELEVTRPSEPCEDPVTSRTSAPRRVPRSCALCSAGAAGIAGVESPVAARRGCIGGPRPLARSGRAPRAGRLPSQGHAPPVGSRRRRALTGAVASRPVPDRGPA